LKIIDLFCGSGGLSTGFSHAGFNIFLGIDNDRSAIKTFSVNHQSSKTLLLDLKKYDLNKLPNCDILIGGPPCKQFSKSKSDKTRNVLKGLELVQIFLRAVYLKKPKYWVMENVASIQKYLPNKIPLSWLGLNLPGELEIPNKVELVAADYGVPQNRVRYLMGKFPIPKQTHFKREITNNSSNKKNFMWRTLGEVINKLPYPLLKSPKGFVGDPNYKLSIKKSELTDHFYNTKLNKDEIRALRKVKEKHPYMGFMPFAENLDRPARTVVALQLGRETLVLYDVNNVYRRMTVRECAVLQTFPITYQFMGSSYATKYRLVGDAVPPILSYKIAQEISSLEGFNARKIPKVNLKINHFTPIPIKSFKTGKRKGNFFEFRKFSESVPGKEQRGCRCEFGNFNFSEQKITLKNFKNKIWGARIYIGEGKNNKIYNINKIKFSKIFKQSNLDPKTIFKITKLEKKIIKFIKSKRKLSGKELHKIWAKGTNTKVLYAFVDGVSSIINKSMPKSKYHNLKVCSKTIDCFPSNGIRIRILLGALGATLLAKRFNHFSSF